MTENVTVIVTVTGKTITGITLSVMQGLFSSRRHFIDETAASGSVQYVKIDRNLGRKMS